MYAQYVLQLYRKTWDNVVALCGDNCNTNSFFSDMICKTLVVCASHCFKLAVQDMLKSDKSLLKKEIELVNKLRHLISAAHL